MASDPFSVQGIGLKEASSIQGWQREREKEVRALRLNSQSR